MQTRDSESTNPILSKGGGITRKPSNAEASERRRRLSQESQLGADDFTPSKGLTSTGAADLLARYGRNELEDVKVPKWLIFCQQLYQPMPIMIWLAIIIEAIIENWPDFGILFCIQMANASLGYYEITKAGDAVAALKASLKPVATVKRDGKWTNMDAALVVPGDLVLLAAGSAIPADCLVNDGTIDVDQAALTGESLPVTMYKGSSCKMGSNVVRGEVEGTVQYTGGETFFGKTASMLQDDGEVGNLQKVLIKIMIVLVIMSMTLCGIVFGYLMDQGEATRDAISFTVVLLVASIPIAIEIVCTTTLALGSKELSKRGAIVKRLAAIEDMAGMTMLCSDKTGTLTMNKMVIQDDPKIYVKGESQYSILRYAAMAAKWHEPARDALDTMVLSQADLPSLDKVEQLDFMPFDPVVKRTEGTVKDESGKTFKTTKGAPRVILKMISDKKVIEQAEEDERSLGERGIRCLAVAKTDGRDNWQLLGLLTFLDPPRLDTKETIRRSIEYGVEVKMITGDHLLIAMETCRALDLGDRVPGQQTVVPVIRGAEGLPMLDPVTKKAPKGMTQKHGEYIREGHGFAQVFPEHKFLIVQVLREMGFKTGMTGDGVNDAPALKKADVGIAVAGATDAARAASDIVLTEEGLSTIVDGIVIARCIFQRMRNFITYRIAATLQLLCFFFIAVLSFKPTDFQPDRNDEPSFDDDDWPDFFKMPVLMLMLITLLNDGTLISVGYDNVTPSKTPNKWNLPALFFVSSVLAGVALGSSLLLLWAGLDSWKEGSIFQETGLGGLRYGQIICMVYLKVSISDFLTLFSARTHDGFFWSSKPSPILLGAACVALLLSTILACVWPTGETDGIPAEGLARDSPESLAFWVWLYCIVWWFAQDLAKVCCYAVMEKYNLFGVNDTLMDDDWVEEGGNEEDTLLPKERGLKEKLISSV
jgi:H+-transporting ATPase